MKQLLLVVGLSMGLSGASFAQQTVSAATASADTTMCIVDRTVSFGWGTLQLMDGREIQAYLPVPTLYPGIDFPFKYYSARPDSKPLPPSQIARVEDVRSMTAGSHYFETMRFPTEKKAKILAERVVNGPVELFLQAEQQRAPLPIPLPGAVAHTAIPYTNSHFFVRRDGKLMQVERGRFNTQMSQFLIAYPALAEKVARAEKTYHYRDMVTIIMKYNRYVENLQGSK